VLNGGVLGSLDGGVCPHSMSFVAYIAIGVLCTVFAGFWVCLFVNLYKEWRDARRMKKKKKSEVEEESEEEEEEESNSYSEHSDSSPSPSSAPSISLREFPDGYRDYNTILATPTKSMCYMTPPRRGKEYFV